MTGQRAGVPLWWTAAGRFSDFRLEAIGEEAVATWTVEAHNSTPWGVAVYKNGVFLPPIVVGNRWSEALVESEDAVAQYDFLLVPLRARYENLRLRTFNLSRRVRATWALSDGVQRVTVHKNTLPSLTVDLSDGAEVAAFTEPAATCSDSRITLTGKWSGDEKTATVECTVTSGGALGAAIVSWSYGGESGQLTTRSYAQPLVNGVRIAFASDTYTFGETFDVEISLPTEWTTDDLPNGRHVFVVQTWKNNLPTPTAEETITISAVPGSPVLDTGFSSYSNGTGTATIGWRVPDEPDIRELWVYRNYPADGVGGLHWRPIQILEAVPGSTVVATVDGLQEGLNRVGARVLNDGEYNEDASAIYEIFLDASLNRVVNPSPPWDVFAVQESDLSITYIAIADSGSEEIEIYHDNQTGTVDYNTVIATIPNPQGPGLQRLKLDGNAFPGDGDYIIAARGKTGATVEENTSIIRAVTFDSSLAPAATGLALEVVG